MSSNFDGQYRKLEKCVSDAGRKICMDSVYKSKPTATSAATMTSVKNMITKSLYCKKTLT